MTIIIDGSHHEGGGQIIRTAVALSALTGKAVKIEKIRAGRPKPGLQAQHLAGLLAVAKLCDAKVTGAEIGSETIEFTPKEIKGGNYRIDVGTAGSISLVLQAMVLPALHAKENVSLRITGGTDVKWSPAISYFEHVFCHFLKKMSAEIIVDIRKRGFYPKGVGIVSVAIKPCKLKALELTERGALKGIEIESVASSGLKGAKIAERQIEGAKKILNAVTNANTEYSDSLSPGSSIHVHAEYENCRLGATALGEQYKPAEKVGEEAAMLLKKQMDSGACIDEWMADQIVPYIALSGGSVKVAEITPHTETNIWVVEKFLGKKFEIDEKAKIIKVK